MYWSELTKKQCSTLFDILKPSMVEMDSGGSDRYQALLQSNTLVSFVFLLEISDCNCRKKWRYTWIQIYSRLPPQSSFPCSKMSRLLYAITVPSCLWSVQFYRYTKTPSVPFLFYRPFNPSRFQSFVNSTFTFGEKTSYLPRNIWWRSYSTLTWR